MGEIRIRQKMRLTPVDQAVGLRKRRGGRLTFNESDPLPLPATLAMFCTAVGSAVPVATSSATSAAGTNRQPEQTKTVKKRIAVLQMMKTDAAVTPHHYNDDRLASEEQVLQLENSQYAR